MFIPYEISIVAASEHSNCTSIKPPDAKHPTRTPERHALQTVLSITHIYPAGKGAEDVFSDVFRNGKIDMELFPRFRLQLVLHQKNQSHQIISCRSPASKNSHTRLHHKR